MAETGLHAADVRADGVTAALFALFAENEKSMKCVDCCGENMIN